MQALNEMGASEFSEASPNFTIPADVILVNNNFNLNMILSVSVSALIAFCTAMAVFLFYGAQLCLQLKGLVNASILLIFFIECIIHPFHSRCIV